MTKRPDQDLFPDHHLVLSHDIWALLLLYKNLRNNFKGEVMDGGAWWAAVSGVTKSWTRLSDFTFTFHFHALEKEMLLHWSGEHPLQCSCLENPKDRGAWWAAIYGIAQSQTD